MIETCLSKEYVLFKSPMAMSDVMSFSYHVRDNVVLLNVHYMRPVRLCIYLSLAWNLPWLAGGQ